MRFFLSLFIALSLSFRLTYAQSLAGKIALSAEVASPKGYNSGLHFPTATIDASQPTLYLSHHLPYGLNELVTTKAAIAFPLKGMNMGVQLQQSGVEGFKYWKGAVIVGQRLGQVRAGLRVNLHQLSVTSEGNLFGSSIDASIYMPLSPKVNIGASLQNILQQTLNHRSTPLPAHLMLGISYTPFKEFQWQVAIHKDMSANPILMAGFRYEWEGFFFTRLQFQSHPNALQWAIGLKKSKWTVELMANRHYLLGYSSQLLLSWQLPPARKSP